ncbi:MAG: hypothetical protein HEQ39_05180 [Rhizobacter sp.]
MKLSGVLLLCLVLLTTLGAFVKSMLDNMGLPNLTLALREPLMLGLSIYGASKLDLFGSKQWVALIAAVMAFSVPYLVSAMVQDRTVVGLYYLRIYLYPFLFFVGCLGIFSSQPKDLLGNALLRFLVQWNAVLFVISAALYVLIQTNPALTGALIGPEPLPSAWFISGGTWMRMGLPMVGPNTLGLIFALHAFVFIGVLLTRKTLLPAVNASNRSLFLGAMLALLGLMLTFSRSSMLLLMLGVPLIFFLPKVLNFSRFFSVGASGLGMLLVVVLIGLVVDNASEGYIGRWIGLNTNFSDPSMQGHASSIDDALRDAHEYMAWGYPKGSVGPKAVLFSSTINNVESSFLGIFYDMGFLFGMLYWIAVFVLYLTGYRNKLQAFLAWGFLFPCFLLPYVFETDVLIYFSFIYLLLGHLTAHPAAVTQSKQQRSPHPAWAVKP